MNKNFNWRITAKKMGIAFLEILIAGTLAYFANSPYLLVIAPILEGIRNVLKNI